MATPAWVRRHRTLQTTLHTIAILELTRQAEDRIDVEHEHTDDWTPRRGMTFASGD